MIRSPVRLSKPMIFATAQTSGRGGWNRNAPCRRAARPTARNRCLSDDRDWRRSQRPRDRCGKLCFSMGKHRLGSVGLRCVTQIGLYPTDAFGEQLGRILSSPIKERCPSSGSGCSKYGRQPHVGSWQYLSVFGTFARTMRDVS